MKLYTLDSQFIEERNSLPPNFSGIIVGSEETKYWILDGKRHRLDGPAVEFSDGTKEWWYTGKRHRIDGPAIECSDGLKYWFVDGEQVSEEQHTLLVNMMKLKGLI